MIHQNTDQKLFFFLPSSALLSSGSAPQAVSQHGNTNTSWHKERMGINAAREQTAFGGCRDRDQVTATMKLLSKQDRK